MGSKRSHHSISNLAKEFVRFDVCAQPCELFWMLAYSSGLEQLLVSHPPAAVS